MKRIRNPRYAPEFLERKLCPSGFAGHSGASALYSNMDPAMSQNATLSANPSLNDAADQSSLSNTVYYAAPVTPDDVANDPATDGASSGDPATDGPGPLDDNSGSSDPTNSDPTDPEPDPEDPEPPDSAPGDPPPVPLPPIPIGPAGPAF